MAGSPTLLPTTAIARSHEPLSAAIDGETVLMLPRRECYVGLNATASLIWERLAAPMVVADLIAAMQREYEGPPEQIAADVMALLGQMVAVDLLTIVAPPGGLTRWSFKRWPCR